MLITPVAIAIVPNARMKMHNVGWRSNRICLLPVPYFLLTFTFPAGFNEVTRSHQSLIYDLLFKTSAAATQQLAQDPRFIGGQIGMVGVLQTWGRNLAYHPHIHYLIPAGGLAMDSQTWLPARQDFLLPVRALSKIFRSKMKAAVCDTDCYKQLPAKVWKQEWVVHCEAGGIRNRRFEIFGSLYLPGGASATLVL